MNLYANNKVPGYSSQIIPLSNIFWMLDPDVDDDSLSNANKELRKKGVEFPLCVVVQSSFAKAILQNPHKHLFPHPFKISQAYRVTQDHLLCWCAVHKGFTGIECYVDNDWEFEPNGRNI